ncbi:MAG TPA: DUF6789 family protein [Xanthobacteraceae bacterium]|nr:DUF6789 family protein [Xanthobacteraceae bacterium]
MAYSTKGLIAGFIATSILSAVMLLLTALGQEDADIVTLIDRFGSIRRLGAWADHFLVGAVLWGAIFAGFEAVTPRAPIWLKGIGFGVLAWLAMMVLFMPAVGAGLFGLTLGIQTPLLMLFLHLIYGAALGVAFSLLDRWSPTPDQAGTR